MRKSSIKRLMVPFVLSICMFCAVDVCADGNYTDKAVKLFRSGTEDGELTLRFYEETPNVPYMGFRQYNENLLESPMHPEYSEDGKLTLKNDLGGEILCDADAGTISSNDWVKVVNPPLPIENEARGLSDMNCAFVRVTDITYEGEPNPVTFDFAKYGIRIYVEEQDVYLPVSVLSNILTDIATNYLRYNGESLFFERIDLYGSDLGSTYLSDALRTEMAGGERPADVINQCYAELCFNFDYLWGHTGKTLLDESVAENGFDQALSDLGEEGEKIKAGLKSTSLEEYISSVLELFMKYLMDGHDAALDMIKLMRDPQFLEYGGLVENLSEGYLDDLLKSPASIKFILRSAITPQRKIAWGEDNYREYGSTAIIRLDDFMPDEVGWAKYYAEGGELPNDCIGIVVDGLQKASENPEIENVLLDLSCNGGGSSDVLMLIVGLTTGQDKLYGINQLTGQKMTITYETDVNFDGVFDEKDKEAAYDFNYGLLTTRQAFSCGNLFPFIMREGGAVIIGEPTGGGSCSIQIGLDIEGFKYMMSSCQWQLTDSAGASVEGGCTVDIPIEPEPDDVLDYIIMKSTGTDEGIPYYIDYFREENLDTLMNEWFSESAELAPAA